LISVAKVTGAVTAIATGKASLTRTQPEPSRRFKLPLIVSKHNYFTKGKKGDVNNNCISHWPDVLIYLLGSHHGCGTVFEDAWNKNTFHKNTEGMDWVYSDLV
jgi:hypothetical protein